MSGHKSWREETDEQLRTDPKFRESYEAARRKLDEAWEVECRYGNCVIFVSPDSSAGPDQSDGWGPIDCPCKASEWDHDPEYACHLCGHELVAPWQQCPGCGAAMGDK